MSKWEGKLEKEKGELLRTPLEREEEEEEIRNVSSSSIYIPEKHIFKKLSFVKLEGKKPFESEWQNIPYDLSSIKK
jgi:hypothetical protein